MSKKEEKSVQSTENERRTELDRQACLFMALSAAIVVFSVLIVPFSHVVSFFESAKVVGICFAGIALGGVLAAMILFMLSFIKLHKAYRANWDRAEGTDEEQKADDEKVSLIDRKTHLINVGITLLGTGVIVMVVSAVTLLILM